MSGDSENAMQIGRVLKQARTRAGLDMRTVEDRTKIRIKYLRALEGEDWDSLPNPAYAKGFLRTYAQLLGLDGEALTDAYRRQVEAEPSSTSYPLGDQVLEHGRRPGGQPPRPRLGILLAVGVVAALALFLVIGLSGDDDEGEDAKSRQAREQQSAGGKRDHRQAARGETVTLELSVKEAVELCLVGGGGKALIDGQVLAAGTEESYERERFELRFPRGFDGDQFRLEVAGKRRTLPRADGPAAYEIVAPQHVRPAPRPGKGCP